MLGRVRKGEDANGSYAAVGCRAVFDPKMWLMARKEREAHVSSSPTEVVSTTFNMSRALISYVTHLASTGILAAVAVSLATNDEEFIQRAKEAVVLSFWIGLRAQQVRVKPANA